MARSAVVLTKTVFEERLIDFDLSGQMATGEEISSVEFLCVPDFGAPHLVEVSDTFSGQVAQVKIKGGTAGVLYELTCQATTSTQKIEQTGTLIVKDDA